MANETHPKLGTLSDEEIRLVEKHRADQHKLSGWRQGAQAVINAFDNNLPDGSLPLETALSQLRWKLKSAMDNPKIY